MFFFFFVFLFYRYIPNLKQSVLLYQITDKLNKPVFTVNDRVD